MSGTLRARLRGTLEAGGFAGDLTPLQIRLRDIAVAEKDRVAATMLAQAVEGIQVYANPELWHRVHEHEEKLAYSDANAIVDPVEVDVTNPDEIAAYMERAYRLEQERQARERAAGNISA